MSLSDRPALEKIPGPPGPGSTDTIRRVRDFGGPLAGPSERYAGRRVGGGKLGSVSVLRPSKHFCRGDGGLVRGNSASSEDLRGGVTSELCCVKLSTFSVHSNLCRPRFHSPPHDASLAGGDPRCLLLVTGLPRIPP
jgi:hypothetical protein